MGRKPSPPLHQRIRAGIAVSEASPGCCVLFQHAALASIYKKLYKDETVPKAVKSIEFRGAALDDLRAFPVTARREAGFQLDRVQNGREPADWKPMQTIGPGVREIRIRDAQGAFRVIYVAKFEEAVFVLHCFQKKSQRTSREDLALTVARYKELVRELKS